MQWSLHRSVTMEPLPRCTCAGTVPGGPPPPLPPPAWLRAPHAGTGALQTLRLREAGWSAAAKSPRVLAPPPLLAGALAHQRTVRGHRAAVYCIAFDRAGRRVMTGSDDRLVKASPHALFGIPSMFLGCSATMHGCKWLLSNCTLVDAPHTDWASVGWAEEGFALANFTTRFERLTVAYGVCC